MGERPKPEDLIQRISELEHQAVARQEAMMAMEEAIERYSDLVDIASDLIHSVSPAGAFLYVNQSWRQTLGYSPEEIRALTLLDIIAPEERDHCGRIFKEVLTGANVDRHRTAFMAKDGRRIVVEGSCHTRFKDGQAVRLTGIFRDIGEQFRSEQALQESESRYRTLFENANDLIQILRPDGHLLFVNRAWRQCLGYCQEELDRLTIFDLVAPESWDHCQEMLHRILSSPEVSPLEAVFITKEGREVMIEGNALTEFQDGRPVSIQCIVRDVTGKKKIEEELLKAQKLESVGVFAGGIAHDFNNLLTAILGNISLAKLKLDQPEQALYHMAATEKASQQAKRLTQQLLTFSKGGAPVKQMTTLVGIIKDSVGFALRGSNVKCEYKLADDLRPLEVDPGQLSQVIQNLVLNGCQAMPNGGTVTLRARNRTLSSYELLTLPEGNYVQLSVEDQGQGIAPELLAKIFDPYFSSKRSGSGLGLAIAYSIIKKHDGLLTVESKVGVGSVFTIYLPASGQKTLPKSEPELQVRSGKGRILVMDDEEMVREVAVEMLAFMGCTTSTAKDGQEAIQLYCQARAAKEPFDVVIMDLTIPGGMGGREALAQLRAIDPTIKAVVSSGYANDPIMANFAEYGFVGIVPKPYRIEELSKTLAALLPPPR